MLTDVQSTEIDEVVRVAAEVAAETAKTVAARVRRRAMQGFAVLCIGIGAAFYQGTSASQTSRDRIAASGTHLAQAGCQREKDIATTVEAIFQDAEKRSAAGLAAASPSQRDNALAFYANTHKLLEPAANADCTRAKVLK